MSSEAEKYYIGVKGLIRAGDAVLLLKRIKPERTYWDLPGGRVGDETLLEALDRELKEEVPGLSAYSVSGIADVYPLPQRVPDGTKLLFVIYAIEANPFEASISQEHSELLWVTKSEFRKLNKEEVEPHYEAIAAALQ